ncbi:MAG: NPCBM/NEW2 domain-containing protein [Polyangiaceae bacterium]
MVRSNGLAFVASVQLCLVAVGCGRERDSRVDAAASDVEANLPPQSDAGSAAAGGPLAQTPPMGFNNWNAFACEVNEALIKETADFFVSSGLKDAGYRYINIDDCWSTMERDAEGRLVPDPVKFPSGIKGVADYIHGLGLKLGIYGDAGTRTCAGYPGSLGNEAIDARTWAEWGVDYLKYDNCYNQSDGSRADFVRRYTAMSDAIASTGRPMVYSICEWGQSQPWQWANGVGHLWRTTGDISDSWPTIRDIIASNAPLAEYAGPGHWNDPDMLEIGNGSLSTIEKQTHMSMWSIMAAPLIIGTDLRIATPETLDILSRREVIAIDQDPLGKQGTVVSSRDGLMVLSKPLASGEVALALYNSSDAQALVDVTAPLAGLAPADGYYLVDLWTGSALEARGTIAAGVPAHGTVMYRARPIESVDVVPPLVSVAGQLGTLIPGVAGGATLSTTVRNHGREAARQLTVSVAAPEGWTITPTDAASSENVASDAALATTWTVTVPPGIGAGDYPLTATVTYAWGAGDAGASVTSELVGAVAVAPPPGTTPLSTIVPLSSSNAFGPVEIDTSNAGTTEGDGSLITIGGRVYTRGLGTNAPSRVAFYLGGSCSALTVDVGIDDEVTANGSASFQILADGNVVAASGVLTAADPAQTLVADLTGALLLELVTDSSDGSSDGDHADWAGPQIVCGGSTAPTIVEQLLFSFEQGDDGFITANATGGSSAPSSAFASAGSQGLEVTSPVDGNWFGLRLAAPLDLSAFSTLRYDVKTTTTGTPGELALEVGPNATWCQGGLWTWTNANASKTITRAFDQIECPAGTTLDTSQVRGIWLYLKDGTFTIDNVRAE